MSFEVIFPFGILYRQLENGLVVGECLFFPNLSRLGSRPERVRDALVANVRQTVTEARTDQVGRFRMATAAEVRTVRVVLEPPRPTAAWRDPVPLTFQAVVWQHGREAALARVPALDIEVVAARPEDLDGLLEREVVAALRRTGLSARLERLAWVQRAARLDVAWVEETIRLPSLRQRARKQLEDAEQDRPSVFKEVATDLCRQFLPPAYELEEVVGQIADALTARQPQSVLLVGPSGVGKSAAVRELVRTRLLYRLSATPFYQTSGSRLVAGMSGFGMWQERCRNLCREASRRRAVVHLSNLVELMEVGKGECDRTGIAGFLRPAIARGELLAIAECTPEQVPLIEREAPQLLDAFRQVRVEEPGPESGRRILERVVSAPPMRHHRMAPEALDAVDRLHRRYASYSAYPGRPLRFLENLLRDAPAEVTPADVLDAFTRESGLPRVLLDPATPLRPAETRDWFASRVMGQPEAVDLVVDLLSTVKAGLTRPGRPIASLLFIGPTGVGKTEMAKALAEFLFGSRERLTRFDMSEFADPMAVGRLVGGVFGSEGLLTAKVREQPFAVLLFDEFEKAHPAFFDLLLQVLGEARLTDAGGRLADFRNAVVILTSNLGAESFQQGAYGFGTGENGLPSPGPAAAKEHFTREVERFLRPELFNRLDRLVPFAPLDAGTVRSIARREWDRVLARDGVRGRSARVVAADEVLEHLARAGFDARYGARPLKRTVERELLAPLARQVNRHPADTALDVEVRIEHDRLEVGVRPRLDAGGRPVSVAQASFGRAGLARQCAELRRQFQALDRCSTVRELRNDVFQLERLERDWLRRQRRGRGLSAGQQAHLARLARLRDLAGAIDRSGAEAVALEDEVLLAYHRAPADAGPEHEPGLTGHGRRLAALLGEWDALLLRLYALGCPDPGTAVLALFSEERNALFELARAYAGVARSASLRVAGAYELRLPTDVDQSVPVDEATFPEPEKSEAGEPKGPVWCWFKDLLLERQPPGRIQRLLARRSIRSPEEFLLEPRAAVLGLVLQFSGDGAHIRFGGESGLHSFRIPPENGVSFETGKVLVEVVDEAPTAYLPPEGITRRGFVGKQERCRLYDREKHTIEDAFLKRTILWAGTDLAGPLVTLLAERMRVVLGRMVGE